MARSIDLISLFQEERELWRPHEPVHEVSVWLRGHVATISADQLRLRDPGPGPGAWSRHRGQVSVMRSRNVA